MSNESDVERLGISHHFLEIYGTLPRAGPGSAADTRRAFDCIHGLPESPRILDLGCGPGAQTVELLRLCPGVVVAVDLLHRMVARTEALARDAGLLDRVEIVQADMATLELEPRSFDLVWSEGALYFMGFEAGLARVFELLRPGGWAAVSEAVWTSEERSEGALAFWEEYAGIDTVGAKAAQIQAAGYEEVRHHILPRSAWMDAYYTPMKRRCDSLEALWADDSAGQAALASARDEIAGFERDGHTFSYAFFVMRRPPLGGRGLLPITQGPRRNAQ